MDQLQFLPPTPQLQRGLEQSRDYRNLRQSSDDKTGVLVPFHRLALIAKCSVLPSLAPSPASCAPPRANLE